MAAPESSDPLPPTGEPEAVRGKPAIYLPARAGVAGAADPVGQQHRIGVVIVEGAVIAQYGQAGRIPSSVQACATTVQNP